MNDFLKQTNYRSPKLLKLASQAPFCFSCGAPNRGQIVAAHYQGPYQHQLGKGVAEKPSDSATAFVCDCCHDKFDGRVRTDDESHEISHEFLLAIVKTHDWLLKTGEMRV